MSPRILYNGATYEVRPPESALDALLRGGADVRFSCKRGSCQTCLLRSTAGPPPAHAQRGLRPGLIETDHLMPCLCHPVEDLELAEADPSVLVLDALVASLERPSPRVLRILLEPEMAVAWTPGQFVNLRTPDGLSRPYSIASVAEEDYFLELHVALVDGGAVSTWLHGALAEGSIVQLQGPLGDCVYDAADPTRDLLLVASGTGIAPLIGVARDALRQGHTGSIRVLHAAASPEEHYLNDRFAALTAAHANLSFEPILGGGLLDAAFQGLPRPEATTLYLCGNPELVYAARVRAVEAGVARSAVRADPFESAHPLWPQDREKLEAWPPDPELWAALDHGPRLRAILQDFYDLAFVDPRLAPFFHNVTQQRAIDKQYEFIYDVFSGEIEFFGLKPFNAHHWMVISDALFDYREELFEGVVRRHGLAEPLIRRWMAFHELFRRELVKTHARGLILGGVEQAHGGFSEEVVDFPMVCDGCAEEIAAGATARMHARTGQLYCARCAAQPSSQS